MTERSAGVRVLFKAPHVRACPRPVLNHPTARTQPPDRAPTDQHLEVINARLNYAEHDFPVTAKLNLTTLRNSYYLSPISSSTRRPHNRPTPARNPSNHRRPA